ncbi:hypothetical protein ACF1BS_27615 [Streptomyces sp. NPDC014748]|uniref:hypothetical protein n=1 Tax=Streptomyces sp. NPDC014748 TaxID=3364905 RepID=UPI0036F71765
MEMWEDGDCPWCRSLLGPAPGASLTGPGTGCGNDRAESRRAGPAAWLERAHLIMPLMAALTVVAALMLTVTLA